MRNQIHRIAILFGCLAVVSAIMFLQASCATIDRNLPESLSGVPWLRHLNERSFDGFYLAKDEKPLFIGIYSMTGDKWKYDGSQLTLWSHTERYPEPFPTRYRVQREDGKLLLTGEDGSKPRSYEACSWSTTLGNNRWVPVYLKNPHGSKPPEDEEVYIKFNEKTGTVSGFAGVNTFSGPYRVSGPTGIKVGPLATTRMYGPAMDYETMFLSVLNRADTILIVREMLFLYEGTEAVAALQAMYY